MGELVNFRRVKKGVQRADKEKSAAANRVTHGTPKHLRKAAKAERQRADQNIEAHKLGPDDNR